MNVSPLNFTYNLKENLWEAMCSNECEKFFVSNGKQCIPLSWLSVYEILFIQTRVFVLRHKNLALNTFMRTTKELLAEFIKYKAGCISHELTLLFSLLHVWRQSSCCTWCISLYSWFDLIEFWIDFSFFDDGLLFV